MRSTSRHSIARILAALTALALVSGCQSPDPEPVVHSKPEPQRGGIFHMAQIEPAGIDPATIDDSYEATLVNQIYGGLLEHDSNFNVLPGVAESWTISRDGLSYTFHLKDGVKFHDGSVVTADDFVYSLTRVFRLDAEEVTLAREYLQVIRGAKAFAMGQADSISGLRAPDARTLVVELEEPYASFLHVMASEIARVVPRHYVESNGDTVLRRAPIGCGPFMLERWDEGEQIVLRRFDEYHGGPAYIDGVVIHTPPDPVLPRAISGFRRGELHAVDLTMGGLDQVIDLKDVSILRRRELSLTFLNFNTSREPFDDPRVRQAIAHALDVGRLTGLDANNRSLATGVLPPGFPGYTPDPKTLAFDPDRARQLLAEAGYPDGEGLGSFVLAMPRRSGGAELMAEDICRQLQAFGLDIELRTYDWDAFRAGLVDNEFETFLLTWIADLPDPDAFFYPLFHSSGSVNYHHYHDADVDWLLDAARAGDTEGTRIEAYRRAEQKILAAAPIVPLHFSSTVLAVRGNVHEMQLSSMGVAALPLHRIWLDPETGHPGRGSEVAR